MSIHHRALATLFVTLLLAAGMFRPSIASAGIHSKTAANVARKARKARKRLMRAVRRKGLASLPAVSGALASHGGTHSDQTPESRLAAPADVVGTPPTLVDIANGDPSQIFWRPGVVAAIANGAASPEQCAEFWAGPTDGMSAGLGACRMAEDLARSFGQVVQSDNSLCYMRNVPTPANEATGGLRIVSGDPPGSDITRLFSVPAHADRVVEVRVTGQDRDQRVMLRVANADTNRAAGNLYKVDLWYCPPTPGGDVRGVDHITLDLNGHLVASDSSNDGDGGASVDMVDGWLVGDGPGAAWDTARPRTAEVMYGRADGRFKSAVQVADDVISTLSWGQFGGDWRSFTVTRFSATGPADTRFVSGAFAGTSGPGNSTGSAEYRDPIYVAAPGLDLVSRVSAVDLATDPFFATPPATPTIDTTGYSCSTPGDVVLTMDFGNPAIAAIKARCEGPRLDGVQLCEHNATIQSAMQNYPTACNSH